MADRRNPLALLARQAGGGAANGYDSKACWHSKYHEPYTNEYFNPQLDFMRQPEGLGHRPDTSAISLKDKVVGGTSYKEPTCNLATLDGQLQPIS